MNPQAKTEAQANPSQNPPSEAPQRSVVDALFDALTLHTAKGLVLVKDAFESAARWLEVRAKTAGELATKLSPPAPEAAQPSTTEASA
ncbi:MAG: hypothetical protein KF764_07310 [Labilithrix sp.]|nr:hypothetical protein [Labilithrix sp.]MBX3220243.1 hypothetical protein [Labilithrix sp.]